MTKDQLISKQARKIAEMKNTLKHVKKVLGVIHGNFIRIGAPLNDNKLKFNRQQLVWAQQVNSTVENLKEQLP